MFNKKDIVTIKYYVFLDTQGTAYERRDSQGHPAVVLDSLRINGEDFYLCAKFQSHDNDSPFFNIMNDNLDRGNALKFTTLDNFQNDSYYFSQEIYLVDSSQIFPIQDFPTISNSGYFRLCSLIEHNNPLFMSFDYSKNLIYSDMNEYIQSTNYNQEVENNINDYNKMYHFDVDISNLKLDQEFRANIQNRDNVENEDVLSQAIIRGKNVANDNRHLVISNENNVINANSNGYLKDINERYNVYEAYNEKFVRDLNNNVGQFLRDNDILPEQVEKFSIGYFTNLSTRESIKTFKNQITNESLLSELNISDIDFDEKILEDRLTIPITNKYDHITGFVAIDYTGEKDIPIIYSKSIDDPALRIENNVFNLNRVDSNTITLVDNPLDVIKLDSLGINNAVCYLGNDYNDLAEQLQEKGINEVNISFKNNSYYEIKALDVGKSLNDLNINTNINLYDEESIRDNFNFNEPNFINYNDFSSNYYQKLTQNPYSNMNDIDLTIELEYNINNYVKDVLIPKAEKFCDISYIDSQTIKTNLLINDSISNPQGLEYLSNIRSISTVSNTNPNDITKKIENKFNEEAKERNLDLDLNNNRIMQQQEIEIDIMR